MIQYDAISRLNIYLLQCIKGKLNTIEGRLSELIGKQIRSDKRVFEQSV